MAKNDEAYEELAMRKKTLGERLTELMNYRGYERTSIRKAYKEKFGLDIQRQTFAKYQKGEVHLPKDIAENISQILDYDSGYLLGKDRCFCKTYAEYQQLMHIVTKEGLIFSNLLRELGFGWTFDPDDDCYSICPGVDIKHAKDFTYSELEAFCNQIKEYALKLLNEKGGGQDESMKVSVPDITESAPKKRKTSKSTRK